MGIFETSDYRKRVSTEFERQLRKAEKVKTEKGTVNVAVLQGTLDFIKNANLLKSQQIDAFRKRLLLLSNEKKYQKNYREEYGDVDDGFINPYERSKKFSIEQVKNKIDERQSQASNSEKRVNETSPNKSTEVKERGM